MGQSEPLRALPTDGQGEDDPTISRGWQVILFFEASVLLPLRGLGRCWGSWPDDRQPKGLKNTPPNILHNVLYAL